MRIIEWLADRIWPWCSLRQGRRDLQLMRDNHTAITKALVEATNQKALAEDRAKRAEGTAIYFQERAEELIRDDPEIRGFLQSSNGSRRSLITYLREKRPTMMSFVAPTSVRFDEPMEPMRTRQTKLIDLNFCMGLSEETPPELVADEISRLVRATILKEWQSQSVLHLTKSR